MKKSAIIFILLILSMLFSLSSCAQNSPQSTEPVTAPDEQKTLWIVTEEDAYDTENGMNQQAHRVINKFNLAHKDVKVTLEILPTEEDNLEARTQRLKEIQTAISAGKGPDAYLIPMDHRTTAPLFKDVQQAMRSGVFADISTYYDADAALGKDDLVKEVMDGGVVDGARYVLPLSYTFPVLYTDRDLMETAGLDLETAASDFFSLYSTFFACGDPQWSVPPLAWAANGYSSFLSQAIDYASGNVLIDEAQMSAFLNTLSARFATNTPMPPLDLDMYFTNGTLFTAQTPIIMNSVDKAVSYAVASKLANQDLIAIPVRAADGDLVANITYYGAVGNSCSDPSLAYEFLREFLTACVQLQEDRLKNIRFSTNAYITGGLPVRGTAVDFWSIEKTIYKSYSIIQRDQQQRKNAATGIALTNEDVPVLNITIDRVHFATYFDRKIMLDAVAKLYYDQADVDTLAKELISQLQVHATGS